MNIIKLLIALAVVGLGYQYWTKHHSKSASELSATLATSQNGFITLPPVDGGNASVVMIVAAENCPEEDARRADFLADQLASNGIPVARAHNVHFSIQNGDASVAKKVMSVMNGELPIVLVNGRAKSNPRLEEVIAEYKATNP